MHAEAFEWVQLNAAPRVPGSVLDLGGRDVNGSPRVLFPSSCYVSVDIAPGTGVDIVADCRTWRPHHRFDVVLCCEVAEHLEDWPAIVGGAHDSLKAGGMFVFTAAGPGRAPHSAVDGGPLREGEWYRNVEPGDLRAALAAFGDVTVDVLGDDVRATALRAV